MYPNLKVREALFRYAAVLNIVMGFGGLTESKVLCNSWLDGASQTSSFTATGDLSPESFLNIARMPVMMCAAR
jgi:hypothetical protein